MKPTLRRELLRHVRNGAVYCERERESVSRLQFEGDSDYVRQRDDNFVSDFYVFEISRIADADRLDAAVRSLDGLFDLPRRFFRERSPQSPSPCRSDDTSPHALQFCT